MNSKLILRIISIVAAVILLQTLYFKFTAHPDSVYIFSTLGMEPAGRIGTGILELIASILLFVPNYRWLGAGLAAGLMGGALMAHITKLGVAVNGDHGQLFILGVIVLVCSLILLWVDRKAIPVIGKLFK
ncbi:MAG: DoxX family protein [Bacteroidia bacterium]|nr:DoxX family protein [Bacteroidia bacterium]